MTNENCFDRLPKIKEKIDLVLVDLPFNQTALKWDKEPFDLKTMWIELKKICKRDCIYVFFCTTKFGYKLIQSNERWFRYDLVWEKSRKVGFLSANKMPLRKHEMVYVFADANEDENNKPLDYKQGIRDYAKQIKQFINKPMKEINEVVGSQFLSHFFTNGHQLRLVPEKDYNKLIEKYNLRDMPGFREYKSLKDEWDSYPKLPPKSPTTYNPQKTEGKPYKTNGRDNVGVYSEKEYKGDPINNKGDRHPTSILQFPNDFEYQNNSSHEMVYVFKDKQGTYNPQKIEGKPYKHSGVRSSNLIYGGGLKCSNQEKTDRHPTTILKFNNPKKSLHRTAKPVDLCEWLVKSYSNEGENVLDFTMGSGSTGIACLNTNRNFIGIEKDETIFKLAQHRLFKHELCQILKNDQ